jgi:hypothetical protein
MLAGLSGFCLFREERWTLTSAGADFDFNFKVNALAVV